ncbi:metallophosphoesterase [Salinisphaera aquimarina]|uniref:Metallophosphoesterase n=1 Tax=Salinisphaera aquimarina TaxID=2094031 RepID=A0ABV7EMI8_9GAMM
MRLLHITDPHLRADPEARLHGWHVEQAFEQVLTHAITRYPDYDALVLGGDLVDDESSAGYDRLNRRLAQLGRPVLAMAGNHDDPALMARLLTHARVHDELALGGWDLHALDSHIPGDDAGRLGPAQLERLDRRLRAGAAPAVVFVHHPPCPMDSAWIDAIGLRDGAELGTLLAGYPRVRAVVCGHAHQAARRSIGTIDCWVTPATMRQFLPHSAAFAEDRDRAPGYRLIELSDDGVFTSRIHRVDAARRACG